METTNTAETFLAEEGYYPIATIEKITKKKIKEVYTLYEWTFSTVKDNGDNYGFKIGMFPSQMGELLRALGAKEVSKDKFEWEMEEMLGHNLSFNVVHVDDKKGGFRAQLSDIKMATGNPDGVMSPEDIKWDE